MTNSAFRAYRYAADHPAFKGRDLTPKGTITDAPRKASMSAQAPSAPGKDDGRKRGGKGGPSDGGQPRGDQTRPGEERPPRDGQRRRSAARRSSTGDSADRCSHGPSTPTAMAC